MPDRHDLIRIMKEDIEGLGALCIQLMGWWMGSFITAIIMLMAADPIGVWKLAIIGTVGALAIVVLVICFLMIGRIKSIAKMCDALLSRV